MLSSYNIFPYISEIFTKTNTPTEKKTRKGHRQANSKRKILMAFKYVKSDYFNKRRNLHMKIKTVRRNIFLST